MRTKFRPNWSYTIREIAEALGFSQQHVGRLLRENGIDHRHLNPRMILVDGDAANRLVRILESKKEKA